MQEANQETVIPCIARIQASLKELSLSYKNTPLLAFTHGQPAVPTTFGKEIAVFYHRIEKILNKLSTHQFEGKLNGAVGNFNALYFVFPEIDWISVSNQFIASLGLTANIVTTQILPSDNLVAYFDLLKLLNSILIDLCQDMWLYISREMLVIKKEKDQVGSSTMPQKVNPILFENAEGNLYVSNSLFEMYSRKLPVSRLQRDLTDSTIKRTFGTAIGHAVVAWKNITKGLSQIQVNTAAMAEELTNHREVIAEGLQMYLKKQGDQKGYEIIQKLFQGKKISKEALAAIMRELHMPLDILTPASYTGLAEKIVEKVCDR